IDHVAGHGDDLIFFYLRQNLLRRLRVEVRRTGCGWFRQCVAYSLLVSIRQTKVVWISTKLLVAVICYQEVVFEAQSAAARPIDSRFDCQYHSLPDCARPRLMRKRRFVRPSTDTMADGMGRLPGISAFGKSRADQTIQLGETRSITRETNCFIENTQ